MSFIKVIAARAAEFAGDIRVKSVFIGLSYCYVRLDDDRAGLAYVFKEDHVAGCNIRLPRRPLAGASAQELLEFAGCGSLPNSICLAVANAILSSQVIPNTSGDFIDNFEIASGTKVGMIGHFRPLVPLLRKKGVELTVFDMHPDCLSGVLPPEQIPERVPDCEIVLMTGTSIINETFDTILSLTNQSCSVVVLGPSTPLASTCYKDLPVAFAAGAMVRDLAATEQVIAEAGGMRVLSPYLDKVTVALK